MLQPPLFTAEVLHSPAQWSDATVAAAWRELCGRYGGLEVLFQSPEWFAHLGREKTNGRRVIVVRDAERTIVALGAVSEQTTELPLTVGARSFGGFRMRALVLLGGQPLAPPDRAVHEVFLAALRDELGDDDCIVMPMLARRSLFHHVVADEVRADPRLFGYAPATPGSGETHSLTMSSTFAAYADVHFTSKQRGNMKRRLHLLERELGPVRLRRFAAADEVAPFLADARMVSAASWQYATVGPHFDPSEDWEQKLADLAQRELLRSYVLYAGERPVAFVLGYGRGDVFYHVKTGYDRSLSRLAPGIAILWLVLDDLGRAGRRQRVSFMFGDAEYKRLFANVHLRCDELMLVRRTVRNAVACATHAAFRAAVGFARDRVRRLAPLRRAGAGEAAPATPIGDQPAAKPAARPIAANAAATKPATTAAASRLTAHPL